MLGLLYDPSQQIITRGREGYVGQGAVWTTLKVAPDRGDLHPDVRELLGPHKDLGHLFRVPCCPLSATAVLCVKQEEVPGCGSAYWSRDPGQGRCDFPSNSPLAVSLSHLSTSHGPPGRQASSSSASWNPAAEALGPSMLLNQPPCAGMALCEAEAVCFQNKKKQATKR